MNENIRFHSNIALADSAFTVLGKDPNKLFQNAALALMQVMADPKEIDANEKRSIKMKSRDLDTLLFDFLSELLLYKDSENLLFSKFEVKIDKTSVGYLLFAKIFGEKIDPKKHKFKIDVKAITMHMFKVVKTKSGYEARVVVDI